MADDIRLVVRVEQQGVVEAIKTTEALERSVKTLSSTYARGGVNYGQYRKGLSQLGSEFGKTEAELRKYANGVRASKKSEEEAKAASSALKAEIKALTAARREANAMNARVNEVARQEAAALKAAATEVRKAKDARRMLRMEFKEGYAAQVQYRAARLRLSQAERDGIITTQQAAAAQKNLGVQLQQGGRHMSRSGVITQQAGYQMGDFLVQVQGGTNWMVAFGQQATQMVGAMYMLPPAVLASSVGIRGLQISVTALIASMGIIIPLVTAIGAYFMRTSESAKKSKDKISDLDAGLKSLDDTLAKFVQTKKASAMGITIEELLGIDGIESATQKMEDAKAKLASLQDSDLYSGPLGGFNKFLTGGSALEAAGMREIEKALQGVADAQARLGELQAMQEEERSTAAQATIADLERQAELARLSIKYGEDSIEVKRKEETYAKALFIQEQLRLGIEGELLTTLIDSYDKMVAMSGVDMTTNVAKAADAAATLASNFRDALRAQAAIGEMNLRNLDESMVYSGRGGDPRKFMGVGDDKGSRDAAAARIQEQIDTAARRGRKGRSGGGGGASQIESMSDAYGKLMDRLNGVDPLITKFNEEVKKLGEWQAKGAISADQHSAAIALLKKELEAAQDPLADFKKKMEDALDNGKNYAKGMEALHSALSDFLFNPFEDGVKGMVRQFADALRRMAADAIAAAIMQKVMGGFGGGGGGIMGAIGGIFGSANGNVFSGGGHVTAYANGGVVNGPTMFPMNNGTGLMGEAGPEAIMPLKRGANGKLGVQVDGASGGQGQGERSIKVINVDDRASIGKYLNSPAGEKIVLNVLRRNGIDR